MSRQDWRWGVVWVAVLCLGIGIIAGCEDSPQNKLTDAKQALASGEIDRAEERLTAAIDADPELSEARRMMASVEMRRGEFELAEEILEQLWADEGFDREGELNADQRQFRQLINEQFGKLYRRWAESVDAADSPERFEKIGRIGLKRNSRDSHLNSLMVEFYQERAERFVERNEKVKAAEQLEHIDELHRFPDSRRDARDRAGQLRREAFDEAARERFRDDIQADLLESDAYDPDSQTIRIAIEPPIDHRLDPGDDGALEQARATAIQSLMPTLSQFALSLAGLEPDEARLAAVEIPALSIKEETFRAGHYDAVFALDVDRLVEMGFAYAEADRLGLDEQVADEAAEELADVVIGEDVELDTRAVD